MAANTDGGDESDALDALLNGNMFKAEEEEREN
jgi:hypothetical protein